MDKIEPKTTTVLYKEKEFVSKKTYKNKIYFRCKHSSKIHESKIHLDENESIENENFSPRSEIITRYKNHESKINKNKNK
jgi:hypothetical protein